MLCNVEHISQSPLTETKIFKHLGCLLENHYATTMLLTLEISIAKTNAIFRRKVLLSCILINSSLELYPLSFVIAFGNTSFWGKWRLLTFKVSGTFQGVSIFLQPAFPIVFWLLLLWWDRMLCPLQTCHRTFWCLVFLF